jgi:hypothetical protein
VLVHRTGVRVAAMAGTGAADAVGATNPRLVGSSAWTLPLRRSGNSTITESLGTVDWLPPVAQTADETGLIGASLVSWRKLLLRRSRRRTLKSTRTASSPYERLCCQVGWSFWLD